MVTLILVIQILVTLEHSQPCTNTCMGLPCSFAHILYLTNTNVVSVNIKGVVVMKLDQLSK